MTQKEIILQQLAACHNETNWFATVQTALKDLTAEQASWHGIGAKHNIWEIAAHLIFWNERHLNRFKGASIEKWSGENNLTFKAGSPDKSEQEWKESVSKLDSILAELYEQIKNADETKLQGQAFEGSDDSWYAVLANISTHNAYHIGQIVTLRKEQGSWNPETGVK